MVIFFLLLLPRPELCRINEDQKVALDLDPYVKKLLNARRRVVLVNNILQNAQVRKADGGWPCCWEPEHLAAVFCGTVALAATLIHRSSIHGSPRAQFLFFLLTVEGCRFFHRGALSVLQKVSSLTEVCNMQAACMLDGDFN